MCWSPVFRAMRCLNDGYIFKRCEMKLAALLAVFVIPVTLSACGPGGATKSDAGTIIGAVAGGVIGNQVGSGSGRVVATAIGAVVGGIVGNEIGRSLDENDRRAAMEAEYRALETGASGQGVPWKNPDSGRYGTVVPYKPYMVGRRHCRDYTHTIYINGQPETMRGKACRSRDGTWKSATS